ncbi:HET-domain-containing protein [Fusarium falciforme]|uniref:HET-domain-containing protein n=1 Tax=Fusarium falciforme TaxID=195108 RepID=UPI002300FD99|nr:HET-domain-containing protein [Fusarium falciforme]WAO93258.1 HET-domain-containing protein [Fusarium falciforme]
MSRPPSAQRDQSPSVQRPEVPKYSYIPLRSSTNSKQFRLLKVHRGADEDEVECELIIHSLDNAPEYEALSYVWGSPVPQARIRLATGYAEVGPSLYAALRGLRYPDSPRMIWADSLCINQADVSERNSQVQIMSDIYSRASRTLIWLSDATPELEGAISTFQSMHSRSTEESHNSGTRTSSESEKTSEGPAQASAPPSLISRIYGPAVASLFSLPWFTRKWVIQEAVKSQNPVFVIGKQTLPWGVLLDVARDSILSTFTIQLQQPQQSQQVAIHAMNLMLMASLRAEEPQNLMALLSATTNFSCTEDKDYLFSVLGLMPPSLRASPLLQPDYDISFSEMLQRLVRWSLEERRSLDFLGLCYFQPSTSGEPSWMPQLTRGFPDIPLPMRKQEYFRAGGPSSITVAFADTSKLNMNGRIIDTIEATAAAWSRGVMAIAEVTEEDFSSRRFADLAETLTWARYREQDTSDSVDAFHGYVNACKHIDSWAVVDGIDFKGFLSLAGPVREPTSSKVSSAIFHQNT